MERKTTKADGKGRLGRTPISPQVKAARQQKICLAAIRVIRENGLDNVSIRHIAAAAEVKTASLYDYFVNKDELLQRVGAEVQLDFLRNMEAGFAVRSRFIERLRFALQSTLNLYLEEPELSRMIAKAIQYSENVVPPAATSVAERIMELTEALMRLGMDEGLLRPEISPSQHGEHFIDLIAGCRERVLFLGRHIELDHECDRILDMFLNGSGSGFMCLDKS
jgi:TetR/AcrR family fatty acid metabolism transcriptional regulator